MTQPDWVRLPDYAQTPLPAHAGHTDIVDFLLAGRAVPAWLRDDLCGRGAMRPARGAIGDVIALRGLFDGIHKPVSPDDFRDGLMELAGHFPLPGDINDAIAARERIYGRYLQGVETQIWQAVIALAHLRQDVFPVVRELRRLITDVVASRNWIERRLALIEQSFQYRRANPNEAVRKALLKLRHMSPGDRLQLFNKARMRRPELHHTDMREPGKWADLVTGDLGLTPHGEASW
ncbi:MAG: hypothetical protein ABID63_13300 [Pseudomonadota bacterium]